MIDFTKRDLPNAIVVDGKSFLLNTDFRVWIRFGKMIENKASLMDLLYVFKNIPEDAELIKNNKKIASELFNFYINKNATPSSSGNTPSYSSDKLYDYILDGEYIYSSFMQAYNIDLVDILYLHWHKFKALFLGLPNDTKMKEIMGLRGYHKDNTKYEVRQLRMKELWKLPKSEIEQEEQQKLLDEINKEFYNS